MRVFFSVIIPSFNREHTLLRAIESVETQSFRDFELIVVDDGSTDNTRMLLESRVVEKKNNFQYIKTKNLGVSHARNTGFKKSSGRWICFLDSDDEWFKEKLQKQFQRIQNSAKLLVHTEEAWIRNGVPVNKMKKHKKGGEDQFIASLDLCLISPSTVAIERSLFEKFGGFNEEFLCCEDYDLWLKVSSHHKVEFINEPLIKKYGGHDDQLSTKFVDMNYYRIKSIDYVIRNMNLSSEKEKAAVSVLVKKSKSLIKGYEKHNKLDKQLEIKEILSRYIS